MAGTVDFYLLHSTFENRWVDTSYCSPMWMPNILCKEEYISACCMFVWVIYRLKDSTFQIEIHKLTYWKYFVLQIWHHQSKMAKLPETSSSVNMMLSSHGKDFSKIDIPCQWPIIFTHHSFNTLLLLETFSQGSTFISWFIRMACFDTVRRLVTRMITRHLLVFYACSYGITMKTRTVKPREGWDRKTQY